MAMALSAFGGNTAVEMPFHPVHVLAERFARLITPAGKGTLDQLTLLFLKVTKLFDECGVSMLAGSDYGGIWVIPGVSLHQEFDLLERAGLSPLKILQMATLNGAVFLNKEATMGRVQTGKAADLVLLAGNPIKSVQNLHKLSGVVRAGKYHPLDELNRRKERVAARSDADDT